MRFQCSHCDQIVSVDNDDMGSMITCGHCNQVDNVPDKEFAPRTVISDFVIIREIGIGRLAKVYLAHQMTLDRNVALKILSSELADDSDFIMDFFREARAAGKLNHPNIVQAYAVDEEDGTYFLAMEHIQGKNLKQMIEDEGPISLEFSIKILHQIAEALSFIWLNHKTCHENVKPENILITQTNAAKLSDLGLSVASKKAVTNYTYMSPEKILGSKIDIRTDVYSLGITFFEMLAGIPPFEAESNQDLRNKQLKETPVNIRKLRNDVPDSYVRILDKCLAKHPDDRYSNPAQLINDIKLAKNSKTVKKARSTARRAKRKENESKQSSTLRKINTVLIISLLLNVILMLVILMKDPPKKNSSQNTLPDEVSRYHQLAVDMNESSISPERAVALFEEVNLFINQFPESPHLPVVKYWKSVLEEITVRAERLEKHNQEKKKEEDSNTLREIKEKDKKKE